jgi:hypothetical protein
MKSFYSYLEELKISLQYHDELNPKLWNGNKLKSEVRVKLLKFADTWADYASIPKNLIQDIIMVGGNVNYKEYKINWDYYKNKIILLKGDNLEITNIERIFLSES